jgi:hypothetical protein
VTALRSGLIIVFIDSVSRTQIVGSTATQFVDEHPKPVHWLDEEVHRPGKTLVGVGQTWLEQGGIGYRHGMNIVVIVVIVAIVVAIVLVLAKRRANQKAEELRQQALEHRGDARASEIAATRQEAEANALAAKANDDLVKAEQQRNAAAVKREVAADLNVRADNIDPDVPNTSP